MEMAVLIFGVMVLVFLLANVAQFFASRKKVKTPFVGEEECALVDDGAHFFSVNRVEWKYRVSPQGVEHSFKDLLFVSETADEIRLHQNNFPYVIRIGSDESGHALSSAAREKILAECNFALRKNLFEALVAEGVTPTCVCDVGNAVWGTDAKAHKFYTTQEGVAVYSYADLAGVNVHTDKNGSVQKISLSVRKQGKNECKRYEICASENGVLLEKLVRMFREVRDDKRSALCKADRGACNVAAKNTERNASQKDEDIVAIWDSAWKTARRAHPMANGCANRENAQEWLSRLSILY